MVNDTSENNNNKNDYGTDYPDDDHHHNVNINTNNDGTKSNESHHDDYDEQVTIKPIQLSGLSQALYIMKRLDAGEYVDQIVERFEGDKQLVKLWMSFLLHNKCIQNPVDHKWIITQRGRQWMEKHEGRGISSTNATRVAKD